MHHHFIDRFAMGDSPIHRLDARVKLVSVLCYTVVLISFGRYSIAGTAPMAVLIAKLPAKLAADALSSSGRSTGLDV